jgi:ABC-type transport system involved in cytochrome c biogenesis permease subunit
LQLEDSPDFGREIQLFERSINPGLQAVRDRDAGRQFNNTDFENILQFTKRYQNFAQAKYVNAIPNPAGKDDNERWKHMGEALLASIGSGQLSLPTQIYGRLISAYRAGDVTGFNQVIQEYNRCLGTAMPGMLSRPAVEFRFNQVEPFYLAMVLYVAVFLLAIFSWLVWPRTLGKTAALLTVLAFTVHTAGLLVRMYLQGRPPVTNLYSSALFVGWAAVLLCLIFERFYKNGIGSMCASVIGFSTLLIAHNLQLDGDTMEMLRAVLDTNFWLATHVIMVTMGYSAQFLAGLLGIIYIFRGVFTSSFDPGIQKTLSRMMYGVICFGALFSLVGTILGGIWADQSWGRFWGWDPKENGALLIVLWNAIVLHARWGGFAKGRGIATMCVFGNIVTSLSWFGTNMLGVGLHSYGFMDRAFGVLSAFILSQFIIMGIGLLPERYWRGLRRREESERESMVDRELPELSGARKT